MPHDALLKLPIADEARDKSVVSVSRASHAAGDPNSPTSRRSVLDAAKVIGLTAAFGTAGHLSQPGIANAASPQQPSTSGVGPSQLLSQARPTQAAITIADIVRNPTDLPRPIGQREPQVVNVAFETIELDGHLDPDAGTTFNFWTFNGIVPGPMVRVRIGDTVAVTLENHAEATMFHNIDFHAVTGPGGGAEATLAEPGETKNFSFKATKPGLFIYHCAVRPVSMHVANGMYGMILVEPEEGLAPVDREFYVMQGEFYTEQAFGTSGLLDSSHEKLLNERPEYFTFNGAVGALTTQHPMQAKVGETVRFFFGVGGPNYTSSLHLIGAIFDRVYAFGALPGPAIANVSTITVPAGGTAIAELKLEVPGRYVLVDHALSRVERGLAAWLDVEGPENADIFAVAALAPPLEPAR